ncbi:MAG: DUF1104 domain-containing protein [Sulfurospirillaceae bacterium]|nr:DUF1104 domain-containing protein [Sulfurospirillaceae bacterium]
MFKLFLILLLFCSLLFAKTDYSDMSTEELLALIGYVNSENEPNLLMELDKRVVHMSDEEKRVYLEFKEAQKHAEK